MTLYFLDSQSEEHKVGPVKLEVGQLTSNSETDILKVMREDLKIRRPEFNSWYQRCWWDDHERFWIDFGSHTEFYIAHEPYPERSEGAAHEDGNGLYSEKVKADGSVCPQ